MQFPIFGGNHLTSWSLADGEMFVSAQYLRTFRTSVGLSACEDARTFFSVKYMKMCSRLTFLRRRSCLALSLYVRMASSASEKPKREIKGAISKEIGVVPVLAGDRFSFTRQGPRTSSCQNRTRKEKARTLKKRKLTKSHHDRWTHVLCARSHTALSTYRLFLPPTPSWQRPCRSKLKCPPSVAYPEAASLLSVPLPSTYRLFLCPPKSSLSFLPPTRSRGLLGLKISSSTRDAVSISSSKPIAKAAENQRTMVGGWEAEPRVASSTAR